MSGNSSQNPFNVLVKKDYFAWKRKLDYGWKHTKNR